jgi:hypothetical protein
MTMLRKAKFAVAFAALGFVLGDTQVPVIDVFVPGTAEAIVGRPLTPGSVAGVARRTTRRVVRRSTIYVATLPTTCVRQNFDGVEVYSCGGTYYQPYGTQYVVVYID